MKKRLKPSIKHFEVATVVRKKPIVEATEAFMNGESLTELFRKATWFVGKKGKFRRAIIAQLGGKEKFKEVSEQFRGTRQLFGGKRRARGPAVLIDDSDVKRIRGSKIRWAIPQASHDHVVETYRSYKRKLNSDEKMPRGTRTAMRDVMKAMREEVRASRDGCWSREQLYEPITVEVKGENGGSMRWRKLIATVYVSPKGNRYVEARANEKATLILDYPDSEFRKQLRLRRYEGSGIERRHQHEKEMIERGKKSLRETRKRKREARRLRRKKKGGTK